MELTSWLTPIFALIGGLAGGILPTFLNGRVAENREELNLIREARRCLARHSASRSAPSTIEYPGMDPAIIHQVQQRSRETFFERYFSASYEVLVALGAIRHRSDRIDGYLRKASWEVTPEDSTWISEELRKMQRSSRNLLRRPD